MDKFFLMWLLGVMLCTGQTEPKHVVYFETDKYNLLETEQNRLLLFLQSLKKKSIKQMSIYGFCDDRGSDSYNMLLSQNRADAIKRVFGKMGVDQRLITNVDGKGEVLLKMVKTEDLNIIRGLNRKVEITVEFKSHSVNTTQNKDDKGRELPLTLESELVVGDKIVLRNILFQTGYSYLLKESIPVLESMAKKLLEKQSLFFTIEGHVCCTSYGRDAVDRGTGKRNLSLARARYIYDYFVKKGVERKRMKYAGLKHKFPLGGEPKYDRRVEIEITYIKY